MVLQYTQYFVLGLTYLGLVLGNFPGLRMNRPTIALVGSAFAIALGVLTLKETWQAIDPNTVVFLLSLMIVNASLSYSGFFKLALASLLRLTRSPLGLLVFGFPLTAITLAIAYFWLSLSF